VLFPLVLVEVRLSVKVSAALTAVEFMRLRHESPNESNVTNPFAADFGGVFR
jgi:hypothetical protein